MTHRTKNGTIAVKAICAVLFLLFTFCYIYYYQPDVLAVSQHLLSGGKTVYEPTVGAVLLTLVLYLLQLGVYSLTRLQHEGHAMTYFPSLLVLTVLTDVSPDVTTRFSFGAWLVVFPVLLLLFAGCAYILRQWELYGSASHAKDWKLRALWMNGLTMAGLFMFAGLFSNNNDVFHYRMRAESCLIRHDWQGAASVGRKSLATDSSLTMLRAYALAKQGLLGEQLFEYPLQGGSRALLPDSNTVKMLMFKEKFLYHDLGIRLRQQLSPKRYLNFMERHNIIKPMGKEYFLTACLLDKELERFAHKIGKYYELNDSLPKHYKEALTLYTHLHSAPCVVYQNAVMDADYEDYQKLYRSETNAVIRKAKLKDTYGNTYWYYYEYAE